MHLPFVTGQRLSTAKHGRAVEALQLGIVYREPHTVNTKSMVHQQENCDTKLRHYYFQFILNTIQHYLIYTQSP